ANPDVIRLYDRATGRQLHELPVRPSALWFDSPVFLPDSKSLMAIEFSTRNVKTSGNTGMETRFVLWDVATGKERKSFPGVPGTNHELTLSPDGRTLATRQLIPTETSLSGGAIILWETVTGERRGELGRKDWVNSIAFSPDG